MRGRRDCRLLARVEVQLQPRGRTVLHTRCQVRNRDIAQRPDAKQKCTRRRACTRHAALEISAPTNATCCSRRSGARARHRVVAATLRCRDGREALLTLATAAAIDREDVSSRSRSVAAFEASQQRLRRSRPSHLDADLARLVQPVQRVVLERRRAPEERRATVTMRFEGSESVMRHVVSTTRVHLQRNAATEPM